MMKFTGRFQIPVYGGKKYQQLLQDIMEEKLAQAVAAWLEAAEVKIPVWSGAARATLRPLAEKVGFNLLINPTASGRRGLGPAAGVSASTGELEASVEQGVFEFTYSTSLDHLVENEQRRSNLPGLKTPTPYNFLAAARSAFERVAKTARLPDPTMVRDIKRIRVG